MFIILRFLGFGIIWSWLRPTFEDENEKASARKITAYLVSMLFAIGNLRVFYLMKDDNMVIYTLIIDAILLLLIFGILTIKDVINIYKLKTNNRNNA